MKKGFLLVLAAVMAFALCGCGVVLSTLQTKEQTSLQTEKPASNANNVQDTAKEEPANYDSYQTILDDYTDRLRDAVPGLIEEYQTEAADNNEGIQGLAEICYAKVSKLAEISMDGVSEMAEYYYNHGSGSYEEYSEWAGKLQEVYMEEAGKIQDAYMDSAK